jgi:hypothetical protein
LNLKQLNVKQKHLKSKLIYKIDSLSTFSGASFIDWKPKSSLAETIHPDPPALSIDRKREMLEKELVWIADPHAGFVLGRIIDLTDEGALVERVSGKKHESTVSFEQLYPCEEDDQKDVDDNCGLMYLNQVNCRLINHPFLYETVSDVANKKVIQKSTNFSKLFLTIFEYITITVKFKNC